MKILDVKWFCGSTNVGIVQVMTEYSGVKYYIGSFESSTEQEDAEFIAAWGSSFPLDVGDLLFGYNRSIVTLADGTLVDIKRV